MTVLYTLHMFTVYLPYAFLYTRILTVMWGLDNTNIFGDTGRVSSFMYKYVYACENSPSEWYLVTGYHEANKNNFIGSSFGLKFLSCPAGYKIDNFMGTTCVKKKNYEAHMCPQANIYRIYQNKSPIGPQRPLDFRPGVNYAQKSKYNRMKELKEYNKIKRQFYEDCSVTMKPYDNTVKQICKNVHSYNNVDLDNDKVTKLKDMCYDVYCNNGTYEPFCYRIKGTENTSNKFLSNNVLTNYYNVAWTIVILISILYVYTAMHTNDYSDAPDVNFGVDGMVSKIRSKFTPRNYVNTLRMSKDLEYAGKFGSKIGKVGYKVGSKIGNFFKRKS